ncbi:hypothetical protein NP233_g12645 [Leucocoprinus birnbaumii]|uniref:DNA 3'-5' helicase n=1 Tax=Leucocoprinus birnbaumii TaxID=56174 RepID=A0AAD5VFB5_9AGAR|nr:hypothetical protein NP233_g12645 [Leucocoprinus birnbaumii]
MAAKQAGFIPVTTQNDEQETDWLTDPNTQFAWGMMPVGSSLARRLMWWLERLGKEERVYSVNRISSDEHQRPQTNIIYPADSESGSDKKQFGDKVGLEAIQCLEEDTSRFDLLGEVLEVLPGILSAAEKRKALQSLKSDQAQIIVDFLYLILSSPSLLGGSPAWLRKHALIVLRRLCGNVLRYPRCNNLTDIRCLSLEGMGGSLTLHSPNGKETVLWGQLEHPNVTPFYGVFLLDETRVYGQICLVSPSWMENGNIRVYLQKHPESDRKALICDVANGLNYLHGESIIHGDLKGWITATAPAGRTFGWLSPELLRDNAIPTRKSDIWAFGCVCYEILTRLTPFHECATDYHIIRKLILQELPARVGDDKGLGPSDRVDPRMRQLIYWCWDLKPSDRPTCVEILSKLTVELFQTGSQCHEGSAETLEPTSEGASCFRETMRRSAVHPDLHQVLMALKRATQDSYPADRMFYSPLPSPEQIRADVIKRFEIHPCLYQIHDALAQLRGEDCITIAATGSGKTLTFWIPLLYLPKKAFIFLITALNILGDQNVKELEQYNFTAINLTAENCTDEVFKKIANRDYQVIIVSPERILKDRRFTTLWENKKFLSKLFGASIDEGHCFSEWGAEFRPEYAQLATMPKHILTDIKNKLRMQNSVNTIIRRSNERKDIQLVVERMQYPANSFLDLRRILNLGAGKPKKFMVFVNKRRDAELIVEELWKDIDKTLRDKVAWFHSGMSTEFCEEYIRILRDGEVWGLVCTDAAGMGLDLPDVELVIQWRYMPSLCTLMQQLGRTARGQGVTAVGIYLVEPVYFDDHKRKQKWNNVEDEEGDEDDDQIPVKLVRLEGGSSSVSVEAPRSEDTEDLPATDIKKDPKSIPFPKNRNRSDAEFEEEVMDLYINSKTCSVCRRAVSNRYFENHLAEGRYDDCGCIRCESAEEATQSHCCDVCEPSAFEIPHFTQEPPCVIRSRRMKVPALSIEEMDDKALELKRLLCGWRVTQMKIRDLEDKEFFGPQQVMSERVLWRIVDLGHARKLTDTSVLIKQVQWVDVAEFAQEIIGIVHSVYPILPQPPKPPPKNPTRKAPSKPRISVMGLSAVA